MRYYWNIGREASHNPTKQMTASDFQLHLMAKGVFMVDAGTTATKLGNYRFTLNHAGEREQFYTLQQVKTWAKYNLD